MPGDVRQPFAQAAAARNILNEAETELQRWEPSLEPISTNAGNMGANLMPAEDAQTETTETSQITHPRVEHPRHDNPATGEGSHLKEAVAA